MWEEAGEPGNNPGRHRENVETPLRGLGFEPATVLLYWDINYSVSRIRSWNLVIFYRSALDVKAKKCWTKKSKAHGNN